MICREVLSFREASGWVNSGRNPQSKQGPQKYKNTGAFKTAEF